MNIRRHWSYLLYVLRHKWFVLRACPRVGLPLWAGLVHDLSKFSPSEWGPYARNFFEADGSRRVVRNKDGSYDPSSQADEWKLAWLSHQRNRHHWQAWVVVGDGGRLTPMRIPERYVREMVADWIGAGMAISGQRNPWPWYQDNHHKMVLHPETQILVERIMRDDFIAEGAAQLRREFEERTERRGRRWAFFDL